MWQAYIDDSGHRDHAHVMVLAGFVATVRQWKVFSDEWQQMLDMKPGIKYFKMNEAAAARGQFLHWSEDRITERVRQAYKIIEATRIPFQASIIIRLDAFYRIFTREYFEKSAINPYYIAFMELIMNFARHQKNMRIAEPVEFVFDDQVMEKTKIIEAWDAIKAKAPPEIRDLIGNLPSFRDDEMVLPLQAADLAAWWIRKMSTEEYGPNAKVVELPWQSTRTIPGIQCDFDRKRLRKLRSATLRRMRSTEPKMNLYE